MNNWKVVGYIFLGFGSVFLGYALIAFLSFTVLSSNFIDLTPVALAATAHWFLAAALSFVVGFVGYFAGKENEIVEVEEPKWQRDSIKVGSIWSFPIGAVVFLLAFILQSGSMNPSDLIFGVALPIFSSIVAGSVVGLVALLIICRINDI